MLLTTNQKDYADNLRHACQIIDDAIERSTRKSLRDTFDSSVFDYEKEAIISVCRDMGYTDMVKEFESDYEEEKQEAEL